MVNLIYALLLIATVAPTFAAAQQPITLQDVEAGLPVITADEPMAAEYSAKRAAQYLDRSALNWQKTKKCAYLPHQLVLFICATRTRHDLAQFG